MLWESHLRPLVKDQFGHSFSKQLSAKSLQHLAKRVCSATGWTEGKEVEQIFTVAQRLSTALISSGAAEKLLRAVAAACSAVSAEAEPSLRTWSAGTCSLGRTRWQPGQSSRWQEPGRAVTRAVRLEAEAGYPPHTLLGEQQDVTSVSTSPALTTTTGDAHAGHSSPEHYLTTCDSPGVMLALLESGAMGVSIGKGKLFKDLELPYRQLQMDVRGKLRYFQDQADVDVGEIKRNADTYTHAKEQLVQRAKLFRWAMRVARSGVTSVRCTGHLFVPLVNLRDEASLPEDSLEDSVSILVHGL